MKQMYYGPFWPLGYIGIDYRGSGESLTSGLPGLVETSEYYEAAAYGLIISPCRQTGSTYSDNTGRIYLCAKSPVGTYDSLGYPETVIMAITPTAGVVQVPQAAYGGNRYKLSELGLDADVTGDGAFVTGLMQ